MSVVLCPGDVSRGPDCYSVFASIAWFFVGLIPHWETSKMKKESVAMSLQACSDALVASDMPLVIQRFV